MSAMACAGGLKWSFGAAFRPLHARKQFGCSHCLVLRAHRLQQAANVRNFSGISSFCRAQHRHHREDLLFFKRLSCSVAVSEQKNLIKQLRERTSAPIKDVKLALVTCEWDIEAAQKELRKRGVVLASKKASRIAAEGLIAVAQNEKKAAIIELNCETDFVARNEIFRYLALCLARTVISIDFSESTLGKSLIGVENIESEKIKLVHPKLNVETTIQCAITEVAAMMGENIQLRRGFLLSASSTGVVSTYIHSSIEPGLGQIAGILTLETEDGDAPLDRLQELGSTLAMHIVAARPQFLSRELVSAEDLENERDILKTQAESIGKSQMAIDKIIEGRMRKFFEEVVLLEQKFVMNDSVSVKYLLDSLSKEVGSRVGIGSFLRLEVGEGVPRGAH